MSWPTSSTRLQKVPTHGALVAIFALWHGPRSTTVHSESNPRLSPEDQVIEVVRVQNFYESIQLVSALQTSKHFLHQILTEILLEKGAQ